MKFKTLRMQIEEFQTTNTIIIKNAGTEKQIYTSYASNDEIGITIIYLIRT